jgi:N6-adenosine-specific RNA methylase IME4
MKISDVVVGPRCRRELGDIAGLAQSIAEVGLLHPIVVQPDGVLVAGARRLAACRQLGWGEIPVTVIDVDEIVRGEIAENAQRKNLLPTEIDAIRRVVEPLAKAAAAERRVSAHASPGNFPEHEKGQTRDKVGAFAGVSGRQVEKIARVVEAAEEEPELYGHLVAEMDRTGRVDGVYKRFKIIGQADVIRQEPPPLPSNGPYRVIVADPPWPYELRRTDPSHRSALPYPEMPVDAICAIEVAGLAHDDCILWLWTTNAHHRDAYAVLDAWGFEHKTTLTWVKNRMGAGHWLRGQTEHCLMAVRGHPIVALSNQTTVLFGLARAHSQKPEEFYELVERFCPASRYAYLFARDNRPGWDMHADEIVPEPPLTDSWPCGARTRGRCKRAAHPGALGGHDQGGAAAAGRASLQTPQR